VNPRDRILGAACLVGWVVGGVYDGAPSDFLWACYIGLGFMGVSLLLRSQSLCAFSAMWLLYGNALWVLELVAGGMGTRPHAVFLHVGGILVAFYALREFRFPASAQWWRVVVGLLVLQRICAWVTPPAANVNLSHAVQEGWEGSFGDYLSYMLLVTASGAVGLAVAEAGLRRVFREAEAA
jgi:hypothetical protein